MQGGGGKVSGYGNIEDQEKVKGERGRVYEWVYTSIRKIGYCII